MLVTANHGMQEWLEHEFLLYTSANEPYGDPIPIKFKDAYGPQDEYNPCDIAIFELEDETADLLEHGWRRFLTPNEFKTQSAGEKAFYLVIGYPTPEIRDRGKVDGKIFTIAQRYWYLTTEVQRDLSLPSSRFALEYTSRAGQKDGSEVPAIHPGGMSGGAVFQLTKSHELLADLSEVRCVGIQSGVVMKSHLTVSGAAGLWQWIVSMNKEKFAHLAQKKS